MKILFPRAVGAFPGWVDTRDLARTIRVRKGANGTGRPAAADALPQGYYGARKRRPLGHRGQKAYRKNLGIRRPR